MFVGFVMIHCRAKSDKILGATIVAADAGNMISEVTVAMQAGMGLGQLASVIHPYPTQVHPDTPKGCFEPCS
jgi:pyruvate/2-oxoglutarate dehydrogenase complex dihydrolipoamide dehydrogenase (E3) component